MSELTEYIGAFHEIKQEIIDGRYKSILAVNSELILHYWSIGNIILRHQSAEGWGSNIMVPRAVTQNLAS